MSSFNDSLHAVMLAMRMVNRETEMRELWGSGFNPLVNYLAVACAPREVGLEILRESVDRRPNCSTMVLTGERCSGADIEHGSDSPILLGVAEVAGVLAPVSRAYSQGRTGREANALSIIFSGGMTLAPEMGETPGNIMADQFNRLTSDRYIDIVGAETMTLNTGEQARVLAGILFARRIERVVFVHVIDHIARFAATVMAALQQLVDEENDRLDRLEKRRSRLGDDPISRSIRAAHRRMPDVLFVALGDWSDGDPRRGRGEGGRGILRAREAFGPMQEVWEIVYRGKHLGCEYAERYYGERHPLKNIGLACPALPPAEMVDLIPLWTKVHMGWDDD